MLECSLVWWIFPVSICLYINTHGVKLRRNSTEGYCCAREFPISRDVLSGAGNMPSGHLSPTRISRCVCVRVIYKIDSLSDISPCQLYVALPARSSRTSGIFLLWRTISPGTSKISTLLWECSIVIFLPVRLEVEEISFRVYFKTHAMYKFKGKHLFIIFLLLSTL